MTESNLDWATLIAEHDDWVGRNFPGDNDGQESILGCIEELGELAHAHLKQKQGIRGTPEEHEAKAKDSIGDITVYLLGVMSAHMRPTQVGLPRTSRRVQSAEEALFYMSTAVGNLGFLAVEPMGRSQWVIPVNDLLHYTMLYCFHRGWDFDTIVTETWNHVKQRDWVKHRAEGASADDPAVKDPDISLPDGKFLDDRVNNPGFTDRVEHMYDDDPAVP